ncbi:hypothetical protein [Saccharibacillus endophyticus]|uniref:YhfM-like domain-containing protein n=1 Tax=Saccharibacillus endophyticus TaxID=2060666 RepID=A0ABQ2A0D5_9BACL|nr:hypothetical protein [Saccharibacillus endophyticus]GGH82730.1 hypothetical protein GCM10007362_34490 [Saccharibacillus endophyticus]
MRIQKTTRIIITAVIFTVTIGILFWGIQANNHRLFNVEEVELIYFSKYENPSTKTTLTDPNEIKIMLKKLNDVKKASFNNENSDIRNPTYEGEIQYKNKSNVIFSIWLDDSGEALIRQKSEFYYLQTDKQSLKEMIEKNM